MAARDARGVLPFSGDLLDFSMSMDLALALPPALQATAQRDAVAVAADVATIVVAVAVVIVAALAGWLLLRLNRVLTEVRAGVHHGLGPVSDRARAISDNVAFITQVVRSDIEGLNASVESLKDRLTQASDVMETRIEEFNALLEVVQGEAEDLFLDTASTVRGVREGARSIASGAERRPAAPAVPGGGPPRARRPGAEPVLSRAEEGDGRPDQG